MNKVFSTISLDITLYVVQNKLCHQYTKETKWKCLVLRLSEMPTYTWVLSPRVPILERLV